MKLETAAPRGARPDLSAARPALVLFTGPSGAPDGLEDLIERVDVRRITNLADVDPGELPAILLLSSEMELRDGLSQVPEHVVVISTDLAGMRTAQGAGRLFLTTADVKSEDALARALRAAARQSGTLLAQSRTQSQLGRMTDTLRELNRVGMALMSERDPEVLLGLILTQARRVSGSDAGSLYLVEKAEDGSERLRFLRAQNDSLPNLPQPNFTLPLSPSSIAGYAAHTGAPLVLDDVYETPKDAPYSFNRAFDRQHGYRAKSMLAVPMMDHRGGVVGVLQLINRKRNPESVIRNEEDAAKHVLPYSDRMVEAVSSLAGQAAVSIENGRLYRDIENLFEGFIKAAVTAIDQRDPTTSGHSVRVAALTCDIAEAVDRAGDGPFGDVKFTREQIKELRYAGLLHDFGKVSVREEVLVKPKKLPNIMYERVQARFDLIRGALQTDFQRRRVAFLMESGRDGLEEFERRIEEEYAQEIQRVEKFHTAVLDANEPRVLPEAAAGILKEIASQTFVDPRGREVPFITHDELHFLSIAKGSLDPEERLQIESHVTHTYNFLLHIPWTEDLAHVAEIAYGHHEKLDGKGYPRGIGGDMLPLQTRIMTVADIFDALTASDRPYKRAMSAEKALDILDMEARTGQLDPRIVKLLLESKVYDRVLSLDWREL